MDPHQTMTGIPSAAALVLMSGESTNHKANCKSALRPSQSEAEAVTDVIKYQWKRAKDEFDNNKQKLTGASVTNRDLGLRKSYTNMTLLRVPHGLEHLNIFSNGDSGSNDDRCTNADSTNGTQPNNNLPLTPRTREQVNQFSMEKEQKIKRSLTEYDDWRRSIREHVEHSISSKVDERLDTPPEEKLRRARLYHQQQQQHLKRNKEFEPVEEQEILETASSRLDRPSEDWQKRFASASKSSYETSGVNPRPLSRLHSTIKETSAAINSMSNPQESRSIPSSSYQTNHPSILEPSPENTLYEQRVKLFSKFNKEGFRDAIRKGELQDGVKIGQYVDVNGTVLTNHGPFWPVGFGPMVPTPHHIVSSNQSHESLWTKETNKLVSNEKAAKRIVQYYGSGVWEQPLLIYDSSSIDPGQLVPPDEQVPLTCPPHLEFESRFESGNLHHVYRVGQWEYELVLKPDMFTERHTQWYYFRVRNMIPQATYTFRIINFTKPDSLYNYGMRPLFYSETNSSAKQQGWVRAGHHVEYNNTSLTDQIKSLPDVVRNRNYFVLSFQVEFPHQKDTCYFAHCYPYPFTRLRNYVEMLMEQTHRQKMFRREILCETRARNTCYLLTITSNQVPDSGKKAIVMTCRVHPGETNSSWVLEGFLDFITSQHHIAQVLRKQYIFKVVPCLNPDGVIVGNYRCSLFGRDMNRNYRRPKREFFPTIWHVKNLIERTMQRNEVLMYVDLHGHSRRHNVFMYGCDASYLEGEAELPENYLNERLFPFLMSMKGPELFSFSKSKFHIKKCKESTGRVVMFRDYKIFNSFTMETSLSGSNTCATMTQPGKHFGIQDLKRVGHVFGEALFEYTKIISDQLAQHDYILELTRVIAHQMIDQSCADTSSAQQTLNTSGAADHGNQLNQSQSSDNQPQQQQPTAEQQKQLKEQQDAHLAAAKAEKDKAVAEVANVLSKTKNLKDCLKLLERIKRADMSVQSETDDSDSTSESEFLDSRSAKLKKKFRSRKKSVQVDSKKSSAEMGSRSGQGGGGDLLASKRTLQSISMYQSPYASRSGGGFPIFTEERILDRKKHTKRPQKHHQSVANGYNESTIISTEPEADERNMDNNDSLRSHNRLHSPPPPPQEQTAIINGSLISTRQHHNHSHASNHSQSHSHSSRNPKFNYSIGNTTPNDAIAHHYSTEGERLEPSPEDSFTQEQCMQSLKPPKTTTLHSTSSRLSASTPTPNNPKAQSQDQVTKRSMTPVKNLFIDAFGDQAQHNLTRQQQMHRNRTPVGSALTTALMPPNGFNHINGNSSLSHLKSTQTTLVHHVNHHHPQNFNPNAPTVGESLAMKALYNGGRAVDRTNGTIISYYIKKK
ncbi:uncharacterized protein LOC142339779 isoform X2 [Convolutriloba macropyga]|uniref:uncharacterized protein LOC142339779 isoform X2 n=1 Tax=Convolutriloba macropyga TaxID=536237 RepID=UPI003F52744C